MKKLRFIMLALGMAAITFAFTPKPTFSTAPTATYYAFTATGVFVGSASSISILKAALCPGANQVFCVQVWTGKTASDAPAGTRLEDLKKPLL